MDTTLSLLPHFVTIDECFQRTTQARRLVPEQQVPDAALQLAHALAAQRFQITLRQRFAIRQLQHIVATARCVEPALRSGAVTAEGSGAGRILECCRP